MERGYHDMAGHYLLPPQDVTLATLGVPPYSPVAADWEDEYPASSGSADGFGPAEPGAWREDNSAPFWIPDDPTLSSLWINDLIRTIDPRANSDIWRENNSAPRYAGWGASDRFAAPYDPRAFALGAFHIPGLPEDAAEWSWHERSPGRASGPELPAQLASMLNRLLGLEFGTEYIPSRRGGSPSIPGRGPGGGGGGGGGGSSAPQGTPPSASGPIYREGGPSPSNLKPRPGEDLSFRDSLSNPYPTLPGGRPAFRPGKPYIEVDPSKLPPGSVHLDNVPPGHVTVSRRVLWETIRDAIMRAGRFPK